MNQTEQRLEHSASTVRTGAPATPEAPAASTGPSVAVAPRRPYLARTAWSWVIRGHQPPTPRASRPRPSGVPPGPGGGPPSPRRTGLVLVGLGLALIAALVAWTMAGGHSAAPSRGTSARPAPTVTTPVAGRSSPTPSVTAPAVPLPKVQATPGAAPSSPPTSESAGLLKVTPTVTGLSPSTAGGCSTITVYGTNLSMSVAVRFGNSVGDVVSASAGSLVVKVPKLGAAATTVPVVLRLGFLQSPPSPSDVFSYTGRGSCQATVKKKAR